MTSIPLLARHIFQYCALHQKAIKRDTQNSSLNRTRQCKHTQNYFNINYRFIPHRRLAHKMFVSFNPIFISLFFLFVSASTRERERYTHTQKFHSINISIQIQQCMINQPTKFQLASMILMRQKSDDEKSCVCSSHARRQQRSSIISTISN
jgi:hypothetical protein